MNFAVRCLLLIFLFFFSIPSFAQVRWSEPKVVKVRLRKANRKVIRFTGKTKPNAVVRIRKNKVKLYLDNGKSRWADIPQKDRVQFPMTAGSDGSFSFQLYLPTTAVEIPVQVKSGKRWRLATVNYRVEGGAYASDLRATEESFRATDDEISQVERKDNYYSRKHDRGMVIQDGKGGGVYKESKIEGWAGIGLSYFDNSIDATGLASVSTNGSTLVIPTFRFGIDYDYSKDLLIKASIRSTSGSTDDITGGTNPVTGKDFNWLGVQVGAVWFMEALKLKKGKLGLDLGFQLQQVPFFRERPQFANYAYFDNSLYNLHIGVLYEGQYKRTWLYEMYARYLYPISTGDAFDMNTSFPLMFEFGGGVKKRITQSLSFGVFGQLHYYSMAVKYANTNPTRNYDVDLSLALFTVDARLIVNF